jgi:hypothetical protein
VKHVSQFLSYLFHPLLIVSYATAVYFFRIPSDFNEGSTVLPFIILGMIVTGTVLLPSLSTLILSRMGKISSMQMDGQEERNWPLLLTAMIYFACYYGMSSRQVPAFVQLFLLGAGASMVFALLINLKWKISLHMIGAGGMCGGIAGFLLASGNGDPQLVATLFLMAGALGTARIFLGAHSPAQVFAGFGIGFTAEFAVMALR